MEYIALLFLSFVVSTVGWSRQQPQLPREDRIRIAEAFHFGTWIQEQVWPGWSKAPFAFMLVGNEEEFLLRHPHATHNFDTMAFDPLLGTKILYRKRLFPTNLLATFPAINGISTIVVGQSANTGVSSSTAWVVTILHEHFHQFQQSQPDYYAATQALGLSHGDETGMWMLSFPFPYDSTEVVEAYSETAQSLLAAIKCEPGDQGKYSKKFLDALARMKKLLSSDDYKYFSFQCWQEGVARYTELKVAEIAAEKYKPSAEFLALKDFRTFKDVADTLRAGILTQLSQPSLSGLKRGAFYSLGAGVALLLDKTQPGWKRKYFRNKFSLENIFPK